MHVDGVMRTCRTHAETVIRFFLGQEVVREKYRSGVSVDATRAEQDDVMQTTPLRLLRRLVNHTSVFSTSLFDVSCFSVAPPPLPPYLPSRTASFIAAPHSTCSPFNLFVFFVFHGILKTLENTSSPTVLIAIYFIELCVLDTCSTSNKTKLYI